MLGSVKALACETAASRRPFTDHFDPSKEGCVLTGVKQETYELHPSFFLLFFSDVVALIGSLLHHTSRYKLKLETGITF
jgi:hypothetical protein